MTLLPGLLVSCDHETVEQPESVTLETILATVGQESKTRNAINSIGNKVVDIQWTASDAISVFYGNSDGKEFVTEGSGKTATFKGSIDVTSDGEGKLTSSLWGVYPYKESTTCDGTYVYYTLQSEQEAAENTFAKKLFPHVARSDNSGMTFYNPCASVRFTVSSSDIKAVSLKGNNGETLAGKAKISMGSEPGSVPKVESIESGETELLMYAPEGGCFKTGVTYYFVLFPAEFSKGLSITYYKQNAHATYSYNNAYTLGRNQFASLSTRDKDLTFESGGLEATDYKDLSESESANCYLVKKAGDYEFKAVKGNTYGTGKTGESVGDVNSVEVLWESFGTTEQPNVGDIISFVSYRDGYIRFSTPTTFAEGNAVIAAKNSKGVILWSWHIWCAEEGWKEQVYNNNAGTMMDRNLGATSAEAGKVGSLGLLYQWGRKDPFLGSASVSSSNKAASTGTWKVDGTSITDNPELTVKNPMTFYKGYSNYMPNGSWDSKKTAFDPCPAGWRVPDGGESGTWAKAANNSNIFNINGSSYGLNFRGTFGSDDTIWYPASGCLSYADGALLSVGNIGFYWSVTPTPSISHDAYYLGFSYFGDVYTSGSIFRAYGRSVRCLQE